MEAIAEALAARGIASLRYQFPYMEAGGRRPDPPAVLEATVRAAVAEAARDRARPPAGRRRQVAGRPDDLRRGGAARRCRAWRGLVFLGFPLHPAEAARR